jgi:hypothetical protein
VFSRGGKVALRTEADQKKEHHAITSKSFQRTDATHFCSQDAYPIEQEASAGWQAQQPRFARRALRSLEPGPGRSSLAANMLLD